jgi:endonuclease/exonuclease/phosphatase family metal-dependent hydrolase
VAAIETVTVASLNLHCGFGRQDEPFDVAAAICQLDAAVICLQEVWRPVRAAPGGAGRAGRPCPDPVADAAAALGGSVRRAHMCGRRSVASLGIRAVSGPGELGIAVLTTLPVAAERVIPLGCAPADHVPRVAQAVDLQLAGGGILRVVNTHLTHALSSPLQLRRLLAWLRQDTARRAAAPAVIVGDLNMPRLLAGQVPGYAAAVRGATYPSDRPRIQLDHMLAARGISYAAGMILPDAGSDHLPVRARLHLSRVEVNGRARS